MNIRLALGGIVVAGAMVVAGQLHENSATADRGGGGVAGSDGADVAVCTLPTTQTFPRVGNVHAFSVATNSFNAGDETLLWQANNSNHPVIAQNMYRIKDGRIDMIGMAWLKHGFCALQNGGCGTCQSCGGGCPQCLGPGCADPYSSSLNGQQTGLGPRSDVNASTGAFPYPYTIAFNQTGNGIYKRLQVHDDDLNPALNPGALYFLEGQYVHVQEGTSSRRHNNASNRRVTLLPSGNSYNLGGGFSTTKRPAIFAWRDHVSGVSIKVVDIPGEPIDGRFHLGYNVTDNGDGTWRYDYAVHNMNSHRSGRAFAVPLPEGVNVLDTYYNDVKYHSGEIYSNEDWTLTIGNGEIAWEGVPFDVNPNANALRWSSTFTFGFTADAPPTDGEVVLELFRPGTPDAIAIAATVPSGPVTPPCPGDLTDDGTIGVPDLLALLACWGPVAPGCEAADLTGSDSIGVPDLLELLASWGNCE